MTSLITNEVLSGTVNGVNRTFTYSQTYVADSTDVTIDGVSRFGGGTDYVELTSTTIYFNTPPETGEIVRSSYLHSDLLDGLDEITQSGLRANLIARYPQMVTIAKHILDGIKIHDPATALTKYDILDLHIADAELTLTAPYWTAAYYDKGAILKACYFLMESQDKAINSGLVVKSKMGDGKGAETEYMRPALNNFGVYSTSQFGRQFEVQQAEAKAAYSPDDFAFFVGGGAY